MGTRAYGSGSIVELSPGRWLVRVQLPADAVTGKRRRRSQVVRGRKRDAQAVLTKLQSTADEPAPAKITVGSLLDRMMQVRRLGDLTRADWLRVIEAYIRPDFGSLPLENLTAHRIDGHYAALRERGVSEARVLKVHEILSVACRQAVASRWASAPATARVARPGKAPKRDRSHTDEVISALSAIAYSSPTWGLWFHLASTIGPRRGELAALQWADVDLDGRELHLTMAAITLTGEGVRVKSTKTGEHRRVPLDDHAVAMLRDARHRQLERLVAAGRPWDDRLYVITHQRSPFGDDPVRPDAATHWFTRSATSSPRHTRRQARTARRPTPPQRDMDARRGHRTAGRRANPRQRPRDAHGQLRARARRAETCGRGSNGTPGCTATQRPERSFGAQMFW